MAIISRIRKFFNLDKGHISLESQFGNEVGLYQNGINRIGAKHAMNGIADGCLITTNEQGPEPFYHQHNDLHIDSMPVVHHHGY